MAILTKKYLLETIADLRQRLRDTTYSLHENETLTDIKNKKLEDELTQACADVVTLGTEKTVLEKKIRELKDTSNEELILLVNSLTVEKNNFESQSKELQEKLHEKSNLYATLQGKYDQTIIERNSFDKILTVIKHKFDMDFGSLPLHFRNDVKAELDKWGSNDSK
jgi:hypothetical protein